MSDVSNLKTAMGEGEGLHPGGCIFSRLMMPFESYHMGMLITCCAGPFSFYAHTLMLSSRKSPNLPHMVKELFGMVHLHGCPVTSSMSN